MRKVLQYFLSVLLTTLITINIAFVVNQKYIFNKKVKTKHQCTPRKKEHVIYADLVMDEVFLHTFCYLH